MISDLAKAGILAGGLFLGLNLINKSKNNQQDNGFLMSGGYTGSSFPLSTTKTETPIIPNVTNVYNYPAPDLSNVFTKKPFSSSNTNSKPSEVYNMPDYGTKTHHYTTPKQRIVKKITDTYKKVQPDKYSTFEQQKAITDKYFTPTINKINNSYLGVSTAFPTKKGVPKALLSNTSSKAPSSPSESKSVEKKQTKKKINGFDNYFKSTILGNMFKKSD